MDAPTMPRNSVPALLDLELDGKDSESTFRRIASQLRERIHAGTLPDGTRLPPSRELAAQLGVARNSVVDAYEELLADGLLEGQGRRGTFVRAGAIRLSTASGREDSMPVALRRHAASFHEETGASQPAFDWRAGQANARSLPLDVWRAACREAGRTLPPQDYGDPCGDPGLREAIVEWLREHRSVRVTAGQIVVTQGTGHALQVIARALVQRGEWCATEDPGYAGAALAFLRAGALLRHVPVDAEGIIVDQAFLPDEAPPVLLHVTPAHQYPLGGRLSGSRRRALVAAARAHGTIILENEYDSEFNYAGSNYPPIFSSASENTLLLSTFSKAVSPALRLGFIAGPPAASEALAGLIERERTHVSWPAQKTVESLLRSGELERHLRRVKRHYAGLRELIKERLAKLGGFIVASGDEGGLHVVIRGRTPAIDQALQDALRSKGILIDTVTQFAAANPDISGFLLAYGHMDTQTLSAALQQLERCVHAIARTRSGRA
jgi:GntR family transcriptional regulator/MocR family aminotransferase